MDRELADQFKNLSSQLEKNATTSESELSVVPVGDVSTTYNIQQQKY